MLLFQKGSPGECRPGSSAATVTRHSRNPHVRAPPSGGEARDSPGSEQRLLPCSTRRAPGTLRTPRAGLWMDWHTVITINPGQASLPARLKYKFSLTWISRLNVKSHTYNLIIYIQLPPRLKVHLYSVKSCKFPYNVSLFKWKRLIQILV